ncbi:MAG: RDD family protein [Alysiella sp.]|uniref:RDD family protein n=1 Tax=Alysiella sp. TaxID=1872483 RepID=UPI0026DC3B5F|nr:RDD family protein [Alysiella sp.]MDO4432986.1 RDD family protein [Alysiella sp.]
MNENHDIPFTYGQEDDIEVELASAWERIAAALLNNIFTFLASLPLIGGLGWAVWQSFQENNLEEISWASLDTPAQTEMVLGWFSHPLFWLGLLILLIYGIVQCVFMSRDGQSIGKKLLNLKVIKQDGSEAGFVGVVLLREIVFNIGCGVLVGIFAALLQMDDAMANALTYAPTLICAIMLFTAAEKRTLQDWIAGTVVVKLPPKHKVKR